MSNPKEFIPKHSKKFCEERGLHFYWIVIVDNLIMKVEQCETCGHKIYFNKDVKGKIDEARWVKLHKADFLQPTGKDKALFKKVYGEPKTPKIKPDFTKPPDG